MANVHETVFLNIAVDRNWQNKNSLKSLYLVSSPQTRELLHAYQFFGVAFAHSPNDRVICYRKPSSDFLAHFAERFGALPQLIENQHDPVDVEEWWQGASKTSVLVDTKALRFASISPLEEKWVTSLSSAAVLPKGSSEFHAGLNRKSVLVNWARELGVPFPRTSGPMSLQEALLAPRPSVIKLDQSAGSAGVFVLADDKAVFARVLERAAKSGLVAFEQEFLNIDEHYYTIAHVEAGQTQALQHYVLKFDGGVSTEHVPLADSSLRVRFKETALLLGAKLAQAGYEGPFGFDGFTARGQLYPAIDLNVRVCKARLFFQALQRLGLPSSAVFRHVFMSEQPQSFKTYLQALKEKLPGERPFLLYWDSVQIAEQRHLAHALIVCAPQSLPKLRDIEFRSSLEVL